MSDLVFTKTPAGALAPADQEAADYVSKLKIGETVTATMRKQRNIRFHKKYFALIAYAFDHWEPRGGLTYQGMPVEKNKERFRKDVAILAGFFETTVNLKGEVRLEAKSISFSQMDEIEFEALYSKTIDVVLQRILTKCTRADLDAVVDELLRFDR